MTTYGSQPHPSRQEPIMQPLTGRLQIGALGKVTMFHKVGVFPPDQWGYMNITIIGEKRPIHLTLGTREALTLADQIYSQAKSTGTKIPSRENNP